MSEEKSCIFHVEGMHCASCVSFIEKTLLGKGGVTAAHVDLAKHTVMILGDLPDDQKDFADQLTEYISGNGYRLSLEKGKTQKNYREFLIAIPAALVFISAFLLLQQFGFVHLLGSGKVNYATAFFIGLLASVSTCLAVVGGIVLSFSATAAKQGEHWRSQAMFHVGRLGGFFLLGGVIGILGGVFQLGIVGTGVLGLIVALVMLFLGVSLLDIFPTAKKFIPSMPKAFADRVHHVSTSSHILAPMLVGMGTFFLPCGFTQSMQVYALSTGSFVTGAFTMLFFAFGTLPVLAALSFGAYEISHKPWKGTFFKAAGIVVIVLALFNVWNAFILLGITS